MTRLALRRAVLMAELLLHEYGWGWAWRQARDEMNPDDRIAEVRRYARYIPYRVVAAVLTACAALAACVVGLPLEAAIGFLFGLLIGLLL